MDYSEPGQVEAGSAKVPELAPEQPTESDEVHVASSSGRVVLDIGPKEFCS
jgi:hypothetical protein